MSVCNEILHLRWGVGRCCGPSIPFRGKFDNVVLKIILYTSDFFQTYSRITIKVKLLKFIPKSSHGYYVKYIDVIEVAVEVAEIPK